MLRTRTGNAGAEALGALKNLAVVRLDYTTVDDKGLDAPCEASRGSRELSMDFTGVTDNGAKTLESMSSLKALNLYHTLVTEKGWQEIKSALPSCEIVFDRDSALPNRRSK